MKRNDAHVGDGGAGKAKEEAQCAQSVGQMARRDWRARQQRGEMERTAARAWGQQQEQRRHEATMETGGAAADLFTHFSTVASPKVSSSPKLASPKVSSSPKHAEGHVFTVCEKGRSGHHRTTKVQTVEEGARQYRRRALTEGWWRRQPEKEGPAPPAPRPFGGGEDDHDKSTGIPRETEEVPPPPLRASPEPRDAPPQLSATLFPRRAVATARAALSSAWHGLAHWWQPPQGQPTGERPHRSTGWGPPPPTSEQGLAALHAGRRGGDNNGTVARAAVRSGSPKED